MAKIEKIAENLEDDPEAAVLCDDRDRRESEDVPEQLYTVTIGIGTEDDLEDDPEAAVLCDEKDERIRN